VHADGRGESCSERSAFRLSRLLTQTLASIAEPVKNFAVIYVVDITEARPRLSLCCLRSRHAPQVPDFNAMYELYDPCSLMFFFRNKARSGLAAGAHASSAHSVFRRTS